MYTRAFCARSLEKIHYLDSEAELGILDTRISDCMYKLKGGCGATALHPFWRAMDLPAEQLQGVYGAGLDVWASVSGEIYRDQAETGMAGGTGDYGFDFE